MRRLNRTFQITLGVAIVGLTVFGLCVGQTQAHPDHGCSSCHVPHAGAGDNSEVPLWNPDHVDNTLTTNYTPSDTTDAILGAPDGASKLCLACHDGTASFMLSRTHVLFGATGDLGGLETTHPISFVYDTQLADDDGELVDPTTLAPDVLDGNSKMQCISCHDVHDTEGRQDEANLRWTYDNSVEEGSEATFCRNCHLK